MFVHPHFQPTDSNACRYSLWRRSSDNRTNFWAPLDAFLRQLRGAILAGLVSNLDRVRMQVPRVAAEPGPLPRQPSVPQIPSVP